MSFPKSMLSCLKLLVQYFDCYIRCCLVIKREAGESHKELPFIISLMFSSLPAAA